MLRIIFVFMIVIAGLPYALKGAFGSLLMYLWLAYFRPDVWVWDTVWLQQFNLSLIAGIILFFQSAVAGLKFRFDLRSSLLFLFLALSLISTLRSTESTWAWIFWVDFAKAVSVTYLLSIVVTDIAQFRTVLVVIAISLGFEAGKQGYMGLLLNPGATNNNPIPMLGDNNGVAVGMLMLVALLTGLIRTAQTVWERRGYQFLLIGIAYRAISTFSRGAFLAGATVMIVYGLRSDRKLRAFLGALFVAGLVLSVLPQSFWDRMNTINTSEEEMDGSSASRLHFWRVALLMAADHPITGVGLNAYARVYDQYDTMGGAHGKGRAVHSIWFGILAEIGYPGLFVYLLLWFLAIKGTTDVARRARKGELPKEFYHFSVALQTGFAACLVGGTFVPTQYCEMSWHFIGLSMALRAIAMKVPAVQLEAAPPLQPALALAKFQLPVYAGGVRRR